MRFLKLSLLPAAIAFSAFFLALPTTGAPKTVHIKRVANGWRFEPSAATLTAGKKVAFVNDTAVTHTATCDECGFDTGDIQPGQTKFVTIRRVGEFSYHCTYHLQQDPPMRAQITISDT